MQTVETLNEGLKRAYTLTITARDIDAKVDAELKRVAPQIRMPGFRPGKVPANLVRKMHGPALAQDALNSAIQEGVQGLLADKQLRPAMQPQVQLDESYEPGKDAEVKVDLEVLPQVPAPTIDAIKLERLTVPVSDEQIDAQLKMFSDNQKRWDDAGDKAAETGDIVTMDFVGKTADGVAFEGGTGTDMAVEIGSGRLIPGFEDQIVGAKAGEERQISVTFPADYQAKELAGQPATFDLTIKSVKTSGEGAIDDEMAKGLGLESLEQLRGLVKGQIEQEHNGLTRTHMKRKLLDQLAGDHDFEVPPSMVEAEFDQIWRQLEHETTHEADPEAARAEMESEREDYRRIAERRVRLGLLLSEIGQANGVEITDREATREELEAAIESEDGFATGTHLHSHDEEGHVHGPDCGHDHTPDQVGGEDHGAEIVSSYEEAAPEQPAAPAKKPRAKKGAPLSAETQILESSPVAAEAAEGATAEDAPAPAAKKPRAPRKPKVAEA